MDLPTFKAALQSVIATASGLPAAAVLYGYPNPGTFQPPKFIRIHFNSDRRSNPDSRSSDASPSIPGAELVQSTILQTWLDVTLDYFSNEAESAAFALRELITKLSANAATDQLEAAGMAITNNPQVQGLPAILETVYRDRAVATLTISSLSIWDETTTYIEHIEGTGTVVSDSGSSASVPYTA